MKHSLALIFSIFAIQAHANNTTVGQICFDELPGEIDIPYDTPDRVKITTLVINKSGAKAFIATEYIGSKNLQASIYLLRNSQYCLAGDLGPATDFKTEGKPGNEGYLPLMVESKSGSDRFIRKFRYKNAKYNLTSCRVKPFGRPYHGCSKAEE